MPDLKKRSPETLARHHIIEADEGNRY